MKKGLTFKTLIGFDDLQKEFELVFNEHRELIKLIMGDNYGIVSSVDVTNDTSPLYPTLNGNVLSVTEGKIVTKNGDTTNVEEFSKDIGNFSEDLAVLFVYEMVGSTEKRVTNDGNASSVWYDRKSAEDSILIIKASMYDSLSYEIKNNSVCVCIIKFSTTPYLDLSNSEYSFNRPWFSPTDISHRNEKGTGSSSIPHSIGINDLSSSNVTLYNQLLSRGIIVSKDVSIAGVPGKSYKVTATIGSDRTIKLSNYPNAIGYCSKGEDGAGYEDVSAFLEEGTNVVRVTDNTEGNVNIDTVITKCLMPPQLNNDSINTELTFGANEDNDVIITEGRQTELVDNTISFANCGTIAKNYEVVFGADGKLHKEPDILGFTSLLSSINTKEYNQEYDIPVKVNVYLENNTSNSAYDIEIVVSGVGVNGAEISDTLTWNTETTKDTTDKYFKKVTSISVTKSENAFTNCKATAFAIADSALDNRLKVALVRWELKSNENYSSITSIKDIRPIATTIRDPFDVSVVKESGKAIATSLYISSLYDDTLPKTELIFVEDFRRVAYLSSQSVNWKITPYGINYPIISSNVFDSRTVTDCYRSRRINVENKSSKYAVILIDSDYETNHNNSVRIGVYSDNNGEEVYNEFSMIPTVNDEGISGNGMFMAYVNSVENIKDIQIIVTGKSAGFVLLRMTGTNSNDYYEV